MPSSEQLWSEENREEQELMAYLKTSVFNTLTKYLKNCTIDAELRNKSQTLNTIEIIKKFLVFDLFSHTTVENQQTMYESILIILHLGVEESYKNVEQK